MDKQCVTPITQVVDKVKEDGGSCFDTNSYAVLHQIKSDLNVLLKMLHQNETQCSNDDSTIFDSPQKTVEVLSGVSHSTNKKDTNTLQQTTVSRNKSVHQNKIMNNPMTKSQSIRAKAAAGISKQNIKPKNVEGRKAARKSRLDIYPCFNISVGSTSESNTEIVSKSNQVQKLTSFWNDRTKNYGQINFDVQTIPDKIDGLEYAFQLRKKLNEEFLSRSPLASLQSRPWQRTMPVDVRESLRSSSNQKLAPTMGISDPNHTTFNKSESKTFKDMSTNTESMKSLLPHTEMKGANFIKDDGRVKIKINLIGDFSTQISTLDNVDAKIERNNKIRDIEINLKESSDKSLIDQNYIDPVFSDCDFCSMRKEINMSKNYSVHSLCVQKENETNKFSDFLCQESSSNFENTTVIGNKTEVLNVFDILHSTMPTEYSTEGKVSNQLFEIVPEANEVSMLSIAEENVCDGETTSYFGGGDSSFVHLYSLSSSLEVNCSTFSNDKVEHSDVNVYSNTGFENELNQLNTLEDESKYFEFSKNTPLNNNIMENISSGTIVRDFKSLSVKSVKVDETEGSENGDLTLTEDLMHVQLNEESEKFNFDIHQEYSNEINQTILLYESPLYNQVDKKNGYIKILEKKLLQKDSHCLETFCNETNHHVDTDHSVKHNIDKTSREFKIHTDKFKLCREMLTKTSSICLNKNAFNNPLMKSFLEHVIKDLCDRNHFEYIWQKYQKGGFQFISERDILYLALCHPVVRKWNCLIDETSLFSEMKRKCRHCKNNTSINCLQKCRNIIELTNVGQIISNNWEEVVMLQCYCIFRHLTKKKAVSFIYHWALSLTMFYIIEEELFGVFSNSKLVYPF